MASTDGEDRCASDDMLIFCVVRVYFSNYRLVQKQVGICEKKSREMDLAHIESTHLLLLQELD
jgi:hypothetical protein